MIVPHAREQALLGLPVVARALLLLCAVLDKVEQGGVRARERVVGFVSALEGSRRGRRGGGGVAEERLEPGLERAYVAVRPLEVGLDVGDERGELDGLFELDGPRARRVERAALVQLGVALVGEAREPVALRGDELDVVGEVVDIFLRRLDLQELEESQ